MMIMLKERSRNIQFEAFHVFKVSMTRVHVLYFLLLIPWLAAGICCKSEQAKADFGHPFA